MVSLLNVIGGYVTSFIDLFGYLGLALSMAFESCNPFLPSEIILPFAGYLASVGKLSFVGAILAGSIGGTAGSLISYYIGRYAADSRIGSRISRGKTTWLTSWFEQYGESAVFFGRLIPMVRTFISLPAGAAKMCVPRFLAYTFAGSLLWSVLLTYSGYILGGNWGLLQDYFHQFSLVLITVLAVVAAGYIYFRLLPQIKQSRLGLNRVRDRLLQVDCEC